MDRPAPDGPAEPGGAERPAESPTAPIEPVRAAGGPAEDQHRGVTTIADRVVARIAARAVAEVDLATGLPRRWLGVRLERTSNPAWVDARVLDGVVTVRVSVAVRWPAPVGQVTRQVRAHLSERLHTLTGLRVGWVDVDVPSLATADGRADR